ncbi:MAG: LLM class flavin-dependent oxidoreductase [Solirubrobacterales bacterium]|nr:LLM class flavin-dependent oxidoreductase [Solirubrobacterales bacterium]
MAGLTPLYYIPNTVEPGHRGDDTVEGWGSLEYSTELARLGERHGWDGALIGTGWGRPETFTVATALAARTERFAPLIAARPGYWQPAQFAAAIATLDRLTGGRVLVNVVSGVDTPGAYGDSVVDQPGRYARTAEFLEIVRRLWAGETVDFDGEHFRVSNATLPLTPEHPRLYFGGASPAAESVAAAHADVQLFWGEPLDGVAERIARLRALSETVGRGHLPLEFGLRITALVRDTSEQAWRDAEAKVARMAEGWSEAGVSHDPRFAVGQRRVTELAQQGEVLDSCLYTAPAKYGGAGAGTTWLVGSADEVAAALARYHALGVSHFIISDTPYREEIVRHGEQLLPALRALV